jgi:hypothetical protein
MRCRRDRCIFLEIPLRTRTTVCFIGSKTSEYAVHFYTTTDTLLYTDAEIEHVIQNPRSISTGEQHLTEQSRVSFSRQ